MSESLLIGAAASSSMSSSAGLAEQNKHLNVHRIIANYLRDREVRARMLQAWTLSRPGLPDTDPRKIEWGFVTDTSDAVRFSPRPLVRGRATDILTAALNFSRDRSKITIMFHTHPRSDTNPRLSRQDLSVARAQNWICVAYGRRGLFYYDGRKERQQ